MFGKRYPLWLPSLSKDISDEILKRLRDRAAVDRRSQNKEVIHLLGISLSSPPVFTDYVVRRKEAADRQAEAWDRLAGRWGSVRRVEEEIANIYSARGEGQDIAM